MRLSLKVVAVLLVVVVASTAQAAQEFDLVAIPAGTAQLGDRRGDANEVLRSVKIPAFRIMRREVTNRQFARFFAASGYRTTVEQAGKAHVWWTR
ncbi:MAG: SUMF1/EgtB/PvdO family nonheme iron enzyme, partial [Pseudomonadota bacterium]